MSPFSSPYPAVSLPCTSFYEHIQQNDGTHPADRAVCTDGITGETLSRTAFRKQALELASSLRRVDEAGLLPIHKGSIVTVFSPNSLLYTLLIVALGASGVRGAFAHASDVDTELAHAYECSRSSHILVHVSLLPKAVRALRQLGISAAETKRRVLVLSHRREIPDECKDQGWVSVDDLSTEPVPGVPEKFDGEQAHETALLFFSSGTAGGHFKPAELSHYNVTAMLEQYAVVFPYFNPDRDVVLSVLPLCGVFGSIFLVLFGYMQGVPFVVLPRFEPPQWLACVSKYKITVTVLVPALVSFLARHPLVDRYDMSTLRLLAISAAPTSPALYDLVLKRFQKLGIRLQVCEGYGLTETAGAVSVVPAPQFDSLKGTVGFMSPNMEGRIVDCNGRDVDEGVPGELWVKGPNVMKRYANDAAATSHTFTPDGWFRTGDLATRDSKGTLSIVGRVKELIKYNGWQVPPADLEAVLLSHPDISDAGVVGVYSEEEATELPRAYVVPKDRNALRSTGERREFARALQHWVKPRVADYKALRGGVFVVDSIPRTPTGRVSRKDVRRLYMAKL